MRSTSDRALGHVADHERGLGQVGTARRVGDHSPGRRGVDGGGEQLALELAEVGEVGRRAPPPRLRAAAQGAQPGARGVDQHPVVAARLVLADRPDRPPVRTVDACGPRRLARAISGARSVWRTRSARCGADLVGGEVGAGLDGQTGEQPRLAAGTGAQVEPAARLPSRLDGHARQREGDELGALVLDRRPPLTHRRYAARVASVEHRADARERARRSAPALDQLGHAGQARSGHERDLRRARCRRRPGQPAPRRRSRRSRRRGRAGPRAAP